MSKEIEALVANSKNPEGLARLFNHVADRLDEIVAARRRGSADRKAEVVSNAE